ncbi:hypothetical protein [Nocardia amamiensis]|uniref:hypothetical protein n=1 Tax=Nocardia amamiensis TaxID=404578 RepID=UPI001E39BB62|nr:hypothetical protein [Nocardia amamiensis]
MVQVGFEFGDYGEGLQEQLAERVCPVGPKLVKISPASAILRANRLTFVVVGTGRGADPPDPALSAEHRAVLTYR